MDFIRFNIFLIVQTFFLLLAIINYTSGGEIVLRIKTPIVNLTAEIKDFLVADANNVQNCYRRKHGASPLQLDSQVSSYSQNWANTLASRDQGLQHSGGQYGENLFSASGPGGVASGGFPIYIWYQESKGYNYGVNDGQGAGHFTQIVWKGSQRAGFGVAKGRQWIYIVANYDPPGNYQNQYTQNVSPPSSDPSDCFQSILLESLDIGEIEIL